MSAAVNVIALCFNNQETADALIKKLSVPGQESQFIVNSHFDLFLKELSSLPKVDCFIIEEGYSACSATDLMLKLKRSKKYKRTVTVMMVDELSTVSDEIIDLNLDCVACSKTTGTDFGKEINKLILKRQKPIIPEHFNVLVLDNNETILELISLHLDRMDHKNFELCTSLNAAKEMLSEKKFHFLLLDWNLDDGTCLELMDFLRTDPNSLMLENNKTLNMVITGRNDVDDIMTLLRYGINDHIIKPFDYDEFEEKVIYALEKYTGKAG